jgi:hypothetical protein
MSFTQNLWSFEIEGFCRLYDIDFSDLDIYYSKKAKKYN